jgi:hypothetical protein
MSQPTPFSIRIFVADGDPDGLRIVDRIGWSGKALVFPRTSYAQVKQRAESNETGVYLLIGPSESGLGETRYIGEGDPVRPRLDNHFSKKDFWTRAVFFIAPTVFNKAHVQYLESSLLRLAREANRVTLDNANTPAPPTLSEPERTDMEAFLQNILLLLPLFGVHAFAKVKPAAAMQTATKSRGRPAVEAAAAYRLHGADYDTTGEETTEGFVVKKGGRIVAQPGAKFAEYCPGPKRLRDELIARGVIRKIATGFVFAQDYTFTAPSFAACIVVGRNINGRTAWKTPAGRTLKEVQEAALAG